MVEERLVGLLAHQRHELGGAGAGVADARVGVGEGARHPGRGSRGEVRLHELCNSSRRLDQASGYYTHSGFVGMSFRLLN